MIDTQDKTFDLVLENLLMLSPGQLDYIQNHIRNLLQDLELEELEQQRVYK